MSKPRAVVVGAGINGLSTAWALVKRGWDVTVADRGPIPNPHAASSDYHRLIRAHYPGAPALSARVAEARAMWETLFADLSSIRAKGPLYVETGVLSISTDEGDWTDRARDAFADGGDQEVLDRHALARRFPQFETDGARYGLFSRSGGALMADRILAGLAAWLAAQDVTLVPHFEARAIDELRGIVTAAEGRTLEGDAVLAAAGVGMAALMGTRIPEPLTPRRSVVLYVEPPADLAEAWARGPSWVDLGGPNDHWGIAPVDGLPLKLGLGAHTRDGDEAREREVAQADIDTILAGYADRLRRIADYRVVDAVANFWTLAPDERFVVRRFDRLVAASVDSGHGFKFGASTGHDLAEAIAEPERFEAVAARIVGM